jgi:hypothetical protein
MKQVVKRLVNNIMQRLFFYTPFPSLKTNPLEFERKSVPERPVSCEEFNAISRNIYVLNHFQCIGNK